LGSSNPHVHGEHEQGYCPELFPDQSKDTHMTGAQKLKAAVPGTKENKLKKLEKEADKVEGNDHRTETLDQNYHQGHHQESLPKDQQDHSHGHMTTGEKIKAAIPGTKEHKAKKAEKEAEKQISGQDRTETLDQNYHQGHRQEAEVISKDQDRDHGHTTGHGHMTTGEKIKAIIPGTKEHKAKKAEKEAEKLERNDIDKDLGHHHESDKNFRRQDQDYPQKEYVVTGEKNTKEPVV